MFSFMTVVRALSDENRVRALMALRDRELCVCQITAFLDLAPSTTSKHLTILRQARLIIGQKRGKWVYYSLATDERHPAEVRGALAWVAASLADNPVIVEDSRRIALILERECAEGEHDGAAEPLPNDGHSREIHILAKESGEEQP